LEKSHESIKCIVTRRPGQNATARRIVMRFFDDNLSIPVDAAREKPVSGVSASPQLLFSGASKPFLSATTPEICFFLRWGLKVTAG
ncbi:MAG: hypothetical protein ABFC56_13740, partial [Clostridiaceae bacterium]